jgi:hypothetical protein
VAERGAQFFERASDTHLGGRFGGSERAGHFSKAALLKEPKHNGLTLRLA